MEEREPIVKLGDWAVVRGAVQERDKLTGLRQLTVVTEEGHLHRTRWRGWRKLLVVPFDLISSALQILDTTRHLLCNSYNTCFSKQSAANVV